MRLRRRARIEWYALLTAYTACGLFAVSVAPIVEFGGDPDVVFLAIFFSGNGMYLFALLNAPRLHQSRYRRRLRARLADAIARSECPRCAYDMTGIGNRRCPECGWGRGEGARG